MTHDQRFKNLSLDYPRQALSSFAAAEVVGLEDEDRETALVLASPLAPAPTTAPAADVIALDSLLDALDAGAPTTGVIVTLHPTTAALALAAQSQLSPHRPAACDAELPALAQAAANATAAGISLFAPAGDEGDCAGLAWPACLSTVNAIGAVYATDLGPVAWCVAATSTECARHGPRLATRKEVAGESRRLMPV